MGTCVRVNITGGEREVTFQQQQLSLAEHCKLGPHYCTLGG